MQHPGHELEDLRCVIWTIWHWNLLATQWDLNALLNQLSTELQKNGETDRHSDMLIVVPPSSNFSNWLHGWRFILTSTLSSLWVASLRHVIKINLWSSSCCSWKSSGRSYITSCDLKLRERLNIHYCCIPVRLVSCISSGKQWQIFTELIIMLHLIWLFNN